jgi:hypothetical protein
VYADEKSTLYADYARLSHEKSVNIEIDRAAMRAVLVRLSFGSDL